MNLGVSRATPLARVSEGGSGDTPRSPIPPGCGCHPLSVWERAVAVPGDTDGLPQGAGGVLLCVGPGVVTGGGWC